MPRCWHNKNLFQKLKKKERKKRTDANQIARNPCPYNLQSVLVCVCGNRGREEGGREWRGDIAYAPRKPWAPFDLIFVPFVAFLLFLSLGLSRGVKNYSYLLCACV